MATSEDTRDTSLPHYGVRAFLTRRRGHRGRLGLTDALTYLYLIAGMLVMFGPVVWLVMSSFKDESLLFEPKPTFLPYRQRAVEVAGYDQPLKLYDVTFRYPQVGGATVTLPDLRAGDGVIQGVDRVLVSSEDQAALAALAPAETTADLPAPQPAPGEPATLWDALRAAPELSTSARLFALAGLEDRLSTDERRTLLAPTNAAWEHLAAEIGPGVYNALLQPEQRDLLARILRGHLLGDRYLEVNLFRNAGQPVTTLDGTALEVTLVDGETRQLAQVGSPQGAKYVMVDPADPQAGEIDVFTYSTPAGSSTLLTPIREVYFNLGNYTGAMDAFNFWTYLRNSLIVTVTATIITLGINSMAAFGLSKYRFAGRDVVLVIIISTLMVPISVIMIPAFLVISKVGWVNNLWGLIIPGAATPTGVFLLRQYMLTIPDELLDSARIDGASEWRIYWQIILPLARPAIAVLAIFSIMWRWNDFLWPLIVLSRNELFTLQVGLNAFQGALDVQWHYILAMTVLTLLPITVVFAFLQRFITSGIATTGMKG